LRLEVESLRMVSAEDAFAPCGCLRNRGPADTANECVSVIGDYKEV
jgi:hypothetical protein